MTTENTASTIDQMVASSSIAPAALRGQTTPDMKLDFEGNVYISTPASPGPVVYSPGLDLGGEISGIDDQIARIEGELAEQKFDPKTGKAANVREGVERSTREAQLASLRGAREYQVLRNAEVQAVRDAEAAAKMVTDREIAAKHAFAQGSPERAAALAKAIADEEAREAARVIVQARRGQ
jgi:hypothetical protein